MLTLEEVSTWTLDEIRGGIHRLLPEGWTFEEKTVSKKAVRARISRPLEDDAELMWEDVHVDMRLLLLGAFGFLWMRNHKPAKDSPWVRRNNPTREAVTRQVIRTTRCTVPDPEDVNPEEVAAVYEEARKKP